MDKSNPPETFGVFKPTDHTVIAFRSLENMEVATAGLIAKGFTEADFVRYSPQEMANLTGAELKAASPLAAFGYELELVKTYLALAESGCNFLVIHAPDDEKLNRVKDVAVNLEVAAAQHYGTFMIQDLISSTAPNAAARDVPTPVR